MNYASFGDRIVPIKYGTRAIDWETGEETPVVKKMMQSIPPDAQAFIDRVRTCTSYELIQASTPEGVRSLPIFPGSKIIWHGVIHPDDIKWEGQKPDKPYYLVMVRTPRHQPNQCDWWWFSMDITITVAATSSQTEERSHPKEIQGSADSSDPQSQLPPQKSLIPIGDRQ